MPVSEKLPVLFFSSLSLITRRNARDELAALVFIKVFMAPDIIYLPPNRIPHFYVATRFYLTAIFI